MNLKTKRGNRHNPWHCLCVHTTTMITQRIRCSRCSNKEAWGRRAASGRARSLPISGADRVTARLPSLEERHSRHGSCLAVSHCAGLGFYVRDGNACRICGQSDVTARRCRARHTLWRYFSKPDLLGRSYDLYCERLLRLLKCKINSAYEKLAVLSKFPYICRQVIFIENNPFTRFIYALKRCPYEKTHPL